MQNQNYDGKIYTFSAQPVCWLRYAAGDPWPAGSPYNLGDRSLFHFGDKSLYGFGMNVDSSFPYDV